MRIEYIIPADEVARIDRANRSARREALARLQVDAMSASQGSGDRTDPASPARS